MIIDDRLPIKDDELIYARCESTDVSEYWVSLAEKAYAKLHGCYQSLNGGHVEEAIFDLTGQVVQIKHLN